MWTHFEWSAVIKHREVKASDDGLHVIYILMNYYPHGSSGEQNILFK